jgi:hypothetical protein
MNRPTRIVIVSLLAAWAAGVTAAARAQAYPPGYSAYGWNGWGGATRAGSTAAGMGAYAAGAGQYNVDTAQARQMNAQTAEQFNDYMWQTSHEHAQVYYQELAAQAKQSNLDYNQVHDRILNNPTEHDLSNGDTLNAILVEITAPKAYARTLQAAGQPLPGSAVRNLPFVYASAQVCYTLDQLASAQAVPRVFSNPAFTEQRKQIRALADELRK